MDKYKLFLAKITDKIKHNEKTGEPTHTSFLDPAEQVEAETLLRDIPHYSFGGHDYAERKMIVIGSSHNCSQKSIQNNKIKLQACWERTF